jgi:hypothetical protein
MNPHAMGVHPVSALGARRERPAWCAHCLVETWNICGLCDRHCTHPSALIPQDGLKEVARLAFLAIINSHPSDWVDMPTGPYAVVTVFDGRHLASVPVRDHTESESVANAWVRAGFEVTVTPWTLGEAR